MSMRWHKLQLGNGSKKSALEFSCCWVCLTLQGHNTKLSEEGEETSRRQREINKMIKIGRRTRCIIRFLISGIFGVSILPYLLSLMSHG